MSEYIIGELLNHFVERNEAEKHRGSGLGRLHGNLLSKPAGDVFNSSSSTNDGKQNVFNACEHSSNGEAVGNGYNDAAVPFEPFSSSEALDDRTSTPELFPCAKDRQFSEQDYREKSDYGESHVKQPPKVEEEEESSYTLAMKTVELSKEALYSGICENPLATIAIFMRNWYRSRETSDGRVRKSDNPEGTAGNSIEHCGMWKRL
jgi:hypothetical protein